MNLKYIKKICIILVIKKIKKPVIIEITWFGIGEEKQFVPKKGIRERQYMPKKEKYFI